MVFKEVGKDLPEVWTPEKEKEFLEGIYVKKKEKVGPNKSNLYIIEVLIEEVAVKKSVWGSKVLDDKMDDVEIGDLIRITYEGENETPKYHKYLVEKDFPEETEAEEGSEDSEKETTETEE